MAVPRPQDAGGSRYLGRSPSSATADVVVVTGLPVVFQGHKDDLRYTNIAQFLSPPAPRDHEATWYLGIFALECTVKKDELAQRRLTMSLASIQNQRQSLGLKDRSVFGATYVEDEFQLWVSVWYNDEAVSYIPCIPCSILC